MNFTAEEIYRIRELRKTQLLSRDVGAAVETIAQEDDGVVRRREELVKKEWSGGEISSQLKPASSYMRCECVQRPDSKMSHKGVSLCAKCRRRDKKMSEIFGRKELQAILAKENQRFVVVKPYSLKMGIAHLEEENGALEGRQQALGVGCSSSSNVAAQSKVNVDSDST